MIGDHTWNAPAARLYGLSLATRSIWRLSGYPQWSQNDRLGEQGQRNGDLLSGVRGSYSICWPYSKRVVGSAVYFDRRGAECAQAQHRTHWRWRRHNAKSPIPRMGLLADASRLPSAPLTAIWGLPFETVIKGQQGHARHMSSMPWS